MSADIDGFFEWRFAQNPGYFESLIELSILGNSYIDAELDIVLSIRLDRMAFDQLSKGLIHPDTFSYVLDSTAIKPFATCPTTPV